VNQFSVVKSRSPRRVSSDADSHDDDQVDDGTESSTDDSNYSEGKSGTSNSKEESGEEEEEDDVEDTVDNPKRILSTPVSKKGEVSDYDTPIVDLLCTNRSRKLERNIRKPGRKSSDKKRRGRQNRNRTSSTSSNDNNQGVFQYCSFYHHVSFLFFSCLTFYNDFFHFSVLLIPFIWQLKNITSLITFNTCWITPVVVRMMILILWWKSPMKPRRTIPMS